MLMLVTYDVCVTDVDGARRLRAISKTCLDYGVRVQNSVFECELDPAQFASLKNTLLNLYDAKNDSLRFYYLGKRGRQRVEHFGPKLTNDPLRDPLIL